jgi:hypothetical protein
MIMLHLEYHKNEGGWEVAIIIGLKEQPYSAVSFACFLSLYF